MKGTNFDASSINRSMRWSNKTPYDVISSHLKDGSFLVLQYSERVDVTPDEWYVIFYHTVVYLFHTSGFFYRTSGHFSHTADQVGRTSERSRKNGLKLKPCWCHTATTRNPGRTRKVVSVRFRVRGHMSEIKTLQEKIKGKLKMLSCMVEDTEKKLKTKDVQASKRNGSALESVIDKTHQLKLQDHELKNKEQWGPWRESVRQYR